MKINEIFLSIQGESSYVGWPTVFVRTTKCPLRCSYCDTTHAFYAGKKRSVNEIVEHVLSFKVKHVCVTGGEPLIQPDVFELMSKLCDLNHTVSLETCGAYSCERVDLRVKKIIDIKTPDSGEGNSFLERNLRYITRHDEIKFVICSEKDFFWAEDTSKKYQLAPKCTVLYSPSFNDVQGKWPLDVLRHF